MSITRAAAAIMRTDRTLSPEFREHVAQMIEAFDQLYTEGLMAEAAHKAINHPYHSDGLEMARAVLFEKRAVDPQVGK